MLLTRPPLALTPKRESAFDLHVLGTPPAFILSQDQTRHPIVFLTLFQQENSKHWFVCLSLDTWNKFVSESTGLLLYFWFLTTLQLFKYHASAFASAAPSN